VEHAQRFIFLALAIGWTIFRLVRYVRVANSKRTGPTAPATVQSPIEPASGTGSGLARFLVAAGILVAGNVAIWPVLFLWPAFDGVPAVWRLTAGVLANLFLIRVASHAAARAGSVLRQSKDDDRNPIK